MRNLAGETIALCEEAGLRYWQHVVALLATVRGDELVPRPSFWQILQTRKAIARGERPQLVCHQNVLVFRRPRGTSAATGSHDDRRADCQPDLAHFADWVADWWLRRGHDLVEGAPRGDAPSDRGVGTRKRRRR